MSLLVMTLLTAAGSDSQFLHDFAETRRFMAGRPVGAQLTPDASAVLFLRSNARDANQTLFEFDVKSGQTRELLTPDMVLNGAAETLSVAEKARLERMRVSSRGFTSFQMSPDGTQLLVALSGKLYVIDRADKKVTPLKSGEGACIDAKFSPDGTMVAYVRSNDVYVISLAKNAESAVTHKGTDEEPNGLAEFVAQEEMSRFSGFWFSPDSKKIAYQHTSHKGMQRFSIVDPMHPEAEADRFPYPRPGQKNATVTLFVTDLAHPKPTPLTWDAVQFPYLATVKWPKKGPLTLVVQNREQTKEQVLSVDVASGKSKVLLTEEDAAWLNLAQEFPHWVDDGSGFFWSSEKSGTTDIEFRNADGSAGAVWAKNAGGYAGASETQMVAYIEATKTMYFYSGANPTQTSLFRTVNGGAPERIKTPADGPAAESAVISKDGSTAIITIASLKAMPHTHVIRTDGTVLGTLPSVAVEPSLKLNIEMLQLSGEVASFAAIIRPTNFVKGQKYPVVLNVYGGPGHLEVLHSTRENLILQWLADQGFIVVKLDGRGTPRRGRAFERAIKNDFATIPANDQIAGLQQLEKLVSEMDAARVGVYGWSFGGYLSALLALSKPEQIKCAVSGAPVVDWLDYDTHYTERYLGVPAEGKSPAYTVSSLLTYVPSAKRPILLIHGTADDNVYFLHSLKLSDAMFKAGKAHSVLPLSNFTHMVPDPLVMQRLWERIADYFKENLAK